MFDFSRINEDQKKAVTTTEGPVLIIAGPGTGKTFTLVKRISYLVLEKHVAPSEIMAVTFTEKAARELLTRISDEFVASDIHININEMYIGTFHAVCLRLLKEYSEYADNEKPLRMIDAFEQIYLVCRNIDQFNCFPEFSELIHTKAYGEAVERKKQCGAETEKEEITGLWLLIIRRNTYVLSLLDGGVSGTPPGYKAGRSAG